MCLLVFVLVLACSAALSAVITVCQCNILDGGKWTEGDRSEVTYDTARRFAQWVASVNPPGSAHPPIAVIGMQELMSEADRSTIEAFLEQYTGAAWDSARTPQGVNSTSGIGMFWRPDLVEFRAEWYLGEKVLEQIDNGYVLKFVGRLFRKQGYQDAFGLFTGKLLWGGAIINGHEVTEEERRQEAVRLKTWISGGETGSPGMSGYPGTVRVIATDLNTDTGTATWNEMNLDYSDPSSQHTIGMSSYPDWLLDITGRRIDYVWWDYDAGAKQSGGFADGPRRSSHFGSDHRAVYATINLHPADLTPPSVTVTTPSSGERVSGTVTVSANAHDDSGVLQVRFLIDGVSVWTDTVAPFTFAWNTLGYAQGCHSIVAEATDASSNRLKSQSPPVVVWVGQPGTGPTIADAKTRPNGDTVVVAEKIVTAAFGNHFYIEEPDRSSGIKITNAAVPAVGSKVTVTGKMGSLNGEREISATSVLVDGSLPVPEPVGMTNEDVGGGPVGAYTAGIYGAKGVNNVGLLVSCWGKVTAIISGYYMYIDDGSGVPDGYGYPGLRVDISGLSGYTPPDVGSYVRVTGISATSSIGGKVQRRVKVRSSADVQAYD